MSVVPPCGPKPTIESVAENLANDRPAYVAPMSDSEREVTRPVSPRPMRSGSRRTSERGNST